MAMLSSCTTTLLSRAPPPLPAPGKPSPAAAALQLRSRRQPAAASVAALRWASSRKESRAALFACHAYVYNDIQPSALVHPVEKNDGDWRLNDEEDQITLKFMVGDTTSQAKLEVATTKDQALLVVRYKKEEEDMDKKSSSSSSPASSLDVRLLMPPGYDSNKMRAMMFNGWLQIFIPKPKREPNTIDISPPKPSPPSTTTTTTTTPPAPAGGGG